MESALIAHPAVLEAAVVPREDVDGLLRPRAVIVLKPGVEAGEELVPALQEHVSTIANQLTQGLESLKDRHPSLIVDVRGKGLLRGLKLAVDPKPIQGALRERKVLVGVAGDNVLRLAPPLIIDQAQVGMAIDAIDGALSAAQ